MVGPPPGDGDGGGSDPSSSMSVPASSLNGEEKEEEKEEDVSGSANNNNNNYKNNAMGNEKPAHAARSSSMPRLTEDRLRRLEAIGFEWKVKHKMRRYYDKQWDQMFDRLLAFKSATSHCMVPKRYPPDMKL